MTNRLTAFVLAFCALPLAIYPGVLMASLMGLAAPQNPRDPLLIVLVAKAFLWSSLLYPVGYVAGVCVGYSSPKTGAAIALFHLMLCISLFAAWYGLDQWRGL